MKRHEYEGRILVKAAYAGYIILTRRNDMSLVRTEITLKNGADIKLAQEGKIKKHEIREMTVNALIDTGAQTLVINEKIREQLGLKMVGTAPGILADGTKAYYDKVGPVRVCWKDRNCLLPALLLPGAKEVLLGALPLEALDLTINPRRELLGVHRGKIAHYIK
jgi:clan AA aspartic protease